jgi:hypothetical protein
MTPLSLTTLSIKGSFATFSITTLCRYAECHYAECGVLFIVLLNVIMPSVVMLSVVELKETLCFTARVGMMFDLNEFVQIIQLMLGLYVISNTVVCIKNVFIYIKF